MELLKIGSSVNIKRTDGRIHSAFVSKVNPITKSVTVEWFERNETKGKEVELAALIQLNSPGSNSNVEQENLESEINPEPEPKVDPEPEAEPEPEPQPKRHATNNLSRAFSQSSSIDEEDIFDDNVYDDGLGEIDDIERYAAGGVEQMKIDVNNSHELNAASKTLLIRSNGSRSSGISANATHGAIRVMTANRLNSAYIPNGQRTNRQTLSTGQASSGVLNGHTTGSSDHVENIPPTSGIARSRSTSNASKMSTATTTTLSAVQSASSSQPRRSYVVKEVERLKENREKRRARQAELKEEKTALMNMDPGNPNWETARMIREFQNTLDFRPLMDGQPIEDHQITVCVRKRPLSQKDILRKEIDVISVPRKDTLIVHEPKTKVDLTKFLEHHKFRFDYALDDTCNNEMVYKYTAKPLVRTIFEGAMATCFAYGQTGSGKTHTMGGEFNGKIQDCKNGIYAMAAKDVFNYLSSPRFSNLNLVVSASFFEIYSGKVFDLLCDKQKLRVLEDGKQQVQIVGLTEKVVECVEEVLKLIQHGNNTRTSGQTSANQNSSRSHAVFQIVLRPPGSMKIHGKFSFIDLAGNERGADTNSANRQIRMEGAEINKSLLVLKECIRALGKQSAHLPFRASKLTQVLRDSFIGEKSKTCMIAMISPGLSSCEHTLNTLRYADRVKELVVKDVHERNDENMMEQMEDDAYDINNDNINDNEYGYQENGCDIPNGQMNENELAHLRSLSEQDMSDDLYNQQVAISDVQQAEEVVVDQHKAINEFLLKFCAESRKLYNSTNYVDYDQDTYSKHGEEIFNQLTEYASQIRDSMSDFRSKLAREEMLSCKPQTNLTQEKR